MAITLGSNIAALRAARQLDKNQQTLSRVFERLASGQRINRAADDAAGLSTAALLEADSRIYTQALRNVNDGVSMLAIAEGALSELARITTRHAELAEQAANGVYTKKQRRALEREANALVDEYNRIAESTQFNGRNLLDSPGTSVTLQAGKGGNAVLSIGLGEDFARTTGDGTFQNYSLINTGETYGYAITAFDANGDFIDDIAYGGSGLHVLLSNGDGTFRNSFSVSGDVVDIQTGDFNGDGKADLAGVSFADSTLSIYLGDGYGSYTHAATHAIPNNGYNVHVADFNGDGAEDIAALTATGAPAAVSFLYGNGAGSFSTPLSRAANGGTFVDLVVGDFNNDDLPDYADFGNGSSVLAVRFNNGNGGFNLASNLTSNERPSDAKAADLNGDGYLDLVATSQEHQNVSVFLGSAGGTFSLASYYGGFAAGQWSSTLEDFNGDGFVDMAVHKEGDGIGILLGNGDGTFRAMVSYSAQNLTNARNGITSGDFNSDGALDIISVTNLTGSIALHLGNTRLESRIADFSFATQADARKALRTAQQTLERITAELGSIGAFQSRLQTAAEVLQTSRENFEAARGRIADADVAAESASLVRLGILQQAGAAVLAQANQQTTLALALL